MRRIRVQLDRRQVVFLRFLLEGYDGLATACTVDRKASVVDLFVPHEQLDELMDLLNAVRQQLGILTFEEYNEETSSAAADTSREGKPRRGAAGKAH